MIREGDLREVGEHGAPLSRWRWEGPQCTAFPSFNSYPNLYNQSVEQGTNVQQQYPTRASSLEPKIRMYTQGPKTPPTDGQLRKGGQRESVWYQCQEPTEPSANNSKTMQVTDNPNQCILEIMPSAPSRKPGALSPQSP